MAQLQQTRSQPDAPAQDESAEAEVPDESDDVTPAMEIRNTEMLQLMRRRSFQRRSSLADVIGEWPTLGVIDKPQFQLKVMSLPIYFVILTLFVDIHSLNFSIQYYAYFNVALRMYRKLSYKYTVCTVVP